MGKLVTPVRVGVLVLTAIVCFAGFFMFVRKGGLSPKDSLHVYAYFRDASGLGPKSRVQIAGIQVGEVQAISLEGQKAKVSLLIKREVPVRLDATLLKRSESLLGDYMLDLTAGTEEAPMMPQDGQITHVQDMSGMEQIFDSLGKITGDIESVTASLKATLGGDKGTASMQHIIANLADMSDELNVTIKQNGERLDSILANFKGVSEDVRGITSSEEQRFKQIVENVQRISEEVQGVLAKVDKVLGTGEGSMQDTVASLKDTLTKLNGSLENVQEITGRINKGEGTVGQLINDKRLGQALTETVVDASDYVSRLVNLQTEVTLRTEYLWYEKTTKDYLTLKVIPKPDKFYTIEIVDDPRGNVVTTTQTNNPATPLSPAHVTNPTTATTGPQALKFSAEFNKRYYFVTVRFGIIENTGGLGADLHFFDDALTFKLDAFDFSDNTLKYPRLKTYANYAFLGHGFVTVGVDDIFNPLLRDPVSRNVISGREYFFGGGIYFNDEDLKAVLSVIPKP